MIAAAVKVFVIEPILYCVSVVASTPVATSAAPRAVSQTVSPSRTTAAAMLGRRLSRCSVAVRRSSSARRDSGVDTSSDDCRDDLTCAVDVVVGHSEVRHRTQDAGAEIAHEDVPLAKAR